MKKILIITVLLSFLVGNASANDVLQLKQKIGQNYTMYWYHNGQHYGMKLLYNNKPYLLVGVGPAAQIVPVGPIKLKVYGYLALKSDLVKKHWPVDVVQIDSYLVPSYENWSLSLRTWTDIAPQDKKHPAYSGEYFLGYQLGDGQQIQIRTEWKYQNQLDQTQNELIQTIGLAYSGKISTAVSLAGYFALETKKPFGKSGWMAIKWAN